MTATRRTTSQVWILVLITFPVLSSIANACSIGRDVPGTPIDAPHAVFEARVVEVHDGEFEFRPGRPTPGQEAIIEVVRSFHGPYRVGERLPTRTPISAGSCGTAVAIGMRVQIWAQFAPPFQIRGAMREESDQPGGPFAEVALAPGEKHRGRGQALAHIWIRGSVSDRLAAELLERARPDSQEECEIASSRSYVQVGCGTAFDGNDARFKVIFQRAGKEWIEILRYTVPASPT